MSQIQEDYEKVLRPYLASSDAYQPLAKFVQSIKKVDDLLACMSRYFLVTNDAGPKETRSLSAFYDLSAALLSIGSVYDGLRYETLAIKSDTLWHDRYAALNKKSKSKLDKQIKFLKASLTPTQKMFLRMFEAHMKKPDDKKIGEWFLKLKFPPLYDCLRAYLEISQQYKDTNKDSLKIFYAMSFRALGIGGNVFAGPYETSIHSEGTVWKRRYDALEPFQKEKIDGAIVDGKKFITTSKYKLKKGRRYEGQYFDFTATDEDTDEPITVTQTQTIDVQIPKEDAQPADQLRKEPESEAQKKFRQEFIEFMKRPGNDKRSEEFMRSIPKLDFTELRQCLHTYLLISGQYGDDERSLAVFFMVAANALKKGDAYYALKFKLNIGRAETTWAKRYAGLNTFNPGLQEQINIEILKKEQSARFIDTLRFAYFQKHAKDSDLHALRNFEINISEEQERILSRAIEKCNYGFDKHSAEDLKAGFDSLTDLLKAETDLLLLFGIFQRCARVPGVQGNLRLQIRWYVAGALYILALVQRANVYENGFTDIEKRFLFTNVDRQNYYFSDFALRLDFLWKNRKPLEDLAEISRANLLLLMYADSVSMKLVTLEEAAAVRALVDAIRKQKPDFLDTLELTVPSGSGTRRLKVNQRVGRVFIVFWNPHDTDVIYVELEGLEGTLFIARNNRMGQVVADEWYGKVYEGTKHLLELDRKLTSLFFDLLWYIPDFVTGGVTGLIEAVVVNFAFEKTIEALGLDATVTGLVLLGATLIAGHPSAKEEPHISSQAVEANAVDNRALGAAAGSEAGITNRHIDNPEISSNGVADSTLPLDPDFEIRGIPRSEGGVEIRGEGDVQTVELPSGSADIEATSGRHLDDPSVISDGVAGQSTSATAVVDSPTPVTTRQDLARAEDRLKAAKADFTKSDNAMKQAQRRVGDVAANVENAQGKRFHSRLERELNAAKQTEKDAIAKYRESKAQVTAVERQVERIRSELASRGELEKSLGNQWNLPDKPLKYRKGTVEVESWDAGGYVGTSKDRRILERLLNEDPGSNMSQVLLKNGKLYPAKGGNKAYWAAHPEIIELAHVLSRREGGRDVYIVMTKSRNQKFGNDLERTGGVFKDDAIVIDGIAIDRMSAIDLGLPADVIARARVIKFEP